MHILRVIVLLLGMLIFLGGIGFAADGDENAAVDGWTQEMVGNLNFTQTRFSNWAQGGEDSWNWQLDLNGKFVKQQGKYNWANTAKVSYGKTKVADDLSKKSADEIHLESVLTYKMGIYVNPYIAVTGETQFTEGFKFTKDSLGNEVKTPISNLLDPAYFTESIGLGYKPVENLKTRLGIALKQTIADQFAQFYTDDDKTANKVETLRSEVGMEAVTDFDCKLNESMLFSSKLEMFSNLKQLNGIDVRWDNLVSAKVAKYIVVSFNLKLFYDRDILVKGQIKQVLAAGLTYTFL